MVVGCGFVEMVNGGLTVRVIKRRESNRKGREKKEKKKAFRWWLAVASLGCGLCRGLRKMERQWERETEGE